MSITNVFETSLVTAAATKQSASLAASKRLNSENILIYKIFIYHRRTSPLARDTLTEMKKRLTTLHYVTLTGAKTRCFDS